jgi:uracil-DNA glycosylase family 4
MQEWDMNALTLLRLYVEWGADEGLEDAPIDRLRAVPAFPAHGHVPSATPRTTPPGLPSGSAGQPRAGASGATPPGSPSDHAMPPHAGGAGAMPAATPGASAAQRAVAAASQAENLDELRAALAAFDGCGLRDTAANLVFAAGDPASGLLLIGDPPGEAEDRSGLPFAGPDGALLDRMLGSVGLAREALLCTPLIPWRPPGGRVPNAGEIAVCLPFLHRLITLAAPRRAVIAGPTAARHLLASTRRRGAAAWNEAAVPGLAAPLPVLVMPSPRMVAQTPSARREAWAALRLLRRTLDSDAAGA